MNEIQISVNLQNAANQNNFPYCHDILQPKPQFAKISASQTTALTVTVPNALSSNFWVISKSILKSFDPADLAHSAFK